MIKGFDHPSATLCFGVAAHAGEAGADRVSESGTRVSTGLGVGLGLGRYLCYIPIRRLSTID